jgi:hypothetical protein
MEDKMESPHRIVARFLRIFSVLAIIIGTAGTASRSIWFPNDTPFSGILGIAFGVCGYAVGELLGYLSEESLN